MRKADDGKSSGALFSGIAGDSMQQVVLCLDWCASTGKTRIHHLTRKDPEEVTSSTGKRSAGKLACCVWKGGKSVSSYLSLHGQGAFDCCARSTSYQHLTGRPSAFTWWAISSSLKVAYAALLFSVRVGVPRQVLISSTCPLWPENKRTLSFNSTVRLMQAAV